MDLRKALMWCLPLCWFGQFAQAQVGNQLSPDLQTVVDSLIRKQMVNQHIVGLSAALVHKGEIIYQEGYGYADRENDLPAGPGTFYRLASISKTITATAVLHAASKGLIDLKADIRQYVPEYPDKGQGPITVEELLACEGGLQHYDQTTPFNLEAQQRYIDEHQDAYDPVAALDVFMDQPLFAAPGTRFNYSTFSFNLLAAVLERATGMSYVDYITEHIALPANLPYLQPEFRAKRPYPEQSAWYKVVSNMAVVDTGHGLDYDDISWKLGGGGFTGTILDMAGFAQALLNQTYLDSATLSRMFTLRRLDGKPTFYGLGIFVNKRKGRVYGSQFGNQLGASTIMYLSPDSLNGVVLLSNTYGTDLLPLAQQLMDRLMIYRPQDTVSPVNMPGLLAQVYWAEEEDSFPKHPGWLHWNPVPGAHQYQIQWSVYPDFTAANTAVVSKDRSYQVPDWGGGKVLFCRIRAVDEYRLVSREGPWSGVCQMPG